MNNDVIKVQLSCGVDYYKGDKGDKPIKGVDYFTQEDIADIVEQIETGGVDLDGYATKEYVDNAVSGVVVSETDPTVPSWAKQASKPTYTAQEVGALPANTELFSGDYNDLSNKPTIPTVPSNVSAFTNDAGYLTDVEFHDTMNMTSVSVNSAGLYVETLDNEQNPVYRTDVMNMGVSANGPSGGVGIGNGQLVFMEPTNGNMLEVTIDENADSLYVNGDKVALVSDIPNLTDYATETYVDTAISNIPTYTFTNGLTESNGTVSWDLNGRIKAGTGSYSVIIGNRSNTANGNYSFAEGSMTNASGLMSHAEGNYTKASGQLQHVEGKNNVEDSNSIFQNIAGNGVSSARSTMFARDWNGNEYLSGNLFVGCNDFTTTANGLTTANAGGSKVATESYVDTAIANIDIPTPIVIEATIAGQPTVDSNGNYQIPLTIASNNMAEAYTQFQTQPSTVGITLDLTAMGLATKIYLDCESFYRNDDGNGGYNYETYGEFNDSSFSQSFGFEFHNINIHLSTGGNSYGTLIGIATVHQLASKANSADLATVATSGDYEDLTNKPTIPTAYTLPTATTSTLGGVKVDGSTITIDGNGVISSSASGGGSSYTAGNGIEIDANNVISANRIDSSAPLWLALLGISTDWSYFSPQVVSIMNNDTQEKFLTGLLNGKIVYVVVNVYWSGLGTTLYNLGYTKVITLNNNGSYEETVITSNMSNWRPDRKYDYWLCGKIIMRVPHNSYNDIFGVGLGKILPYDNTTSGLSASTVKGAIDELASGKQDAIIPSAPTDDGNYVLKVSVSSGTPTYSWVAET